MIVCGLYKISLNSKKKAPIQQNHLRLYSDSLLRQQTVIWHFLPTVVIFFYGGKDRNLVILLFFSTIDSNVAILASLPLCIRDSIDIAVRVNVFRSWSSTEESLCLMSILW